MTVDEFLTEWNDGSPCLLVHTSGSTGMPKPMYVEKRRMEASARTTCRFFGLKEGDTALLCMPLDYIAGKMMVVRSLTCGLTLIAVPPCGHPMADCIAPIDFAAMVPLQVANSLLVPEERERLMQIRHLIVGGGAIDEQLERELRSFPKAVWSTYGMTETLSHIALRRLNGPEASEWYTPLPNVSLSTNEDGCLVVDAPAVHEGPLVTNDRVVLADGKFKVTGRKDNVICSGGIKIQVEEVERLLRRHTQVPFLVTKCKDRKFGEAVVLLTESDDVEDLRVLCRQVLPKFWQPRHCLTIPRLPLTETGKPARKEAERWAAEHLC